MKKVVVIGMTVVLLFSGCGKKPAINSAPASIAAVEGVSGCNPMRPVVASKSHEMMIEEVSNCNLMYPIFIIAVIFLTYYVAYEYTKKKYEKPQSVQILKAQPIPSGLPKPFFDEEKSKQVENDGKVSADTNVSATTDKGINQLPEVDKVSIGTGTGDGSVLIPQLIEVDKVSVGTGTNIIGENIDTISEELSSTISFIEELQNYNKELQLQNEKIAGIVEEQTKELQLQNKRLADIVEEKKVEKELEIASNTLQLAFFIAEQNSQIALMKEEINYLKNPGLLIEE
ncbi:MAG: hypothetical protein LBN01_00840 [Endomicrobium sp.]|jgi:hypothetical protein|nr:hypothetical protein [Endomicrobium sp.]